MLVPCFRGSVFLSKRLGKTSHLNSSERSALYYGLIFFWYDVKNGQREGEGTILSCGSLCTRNHLERLFFFNHFCHQLKSLRDEQGR